MNAISIEPALVTVVIPVWGDYADRYLAEALDSLRVQLVPARAVLVDNLSDAPVIGRREVEVIRTPMRLTLGAARNAGLAAVQTPYVVFWDADDIMLPGALAALVAVAAKQRDAVVVGGLIVEATRGVRHHWPRRWTIGLARRQSAFAMVHCVSSLFPTIGVLIRTDAARAAGGFPDADAGDDWALGASLAFRGRIAFVDDCTRLYRAHDKSVSFGWRRPQIIANAQGVRDRMRSDPAVPRWAKRLVPVVAVLQSIVIFGIRPVARLARRPPNSAAVAASPVVSHRQPTRD